MPKHFWYHMKRLEQEINWLDFRLAISNFKHIMEKCYNTMKMLCRNVSFSIVRNLKHTSINIYLEKLTLWTDYAATDQNYEETLWSNINFSQIFEFFISVVCQTRKFEMTKLQNLQNRHLPLTLEFCDISSSKVFDHNLYLNVVWV